MPAKKKGGKNFRLFSSGRFNQNESCVLERVVQTEVGRNIFVIAAEQPADVAENVDAVVYPVRNAALNAAQGHVVQRMNGVESADGNFVAAAENLNDTRLEVKLGRFSVQRQRFFKFDSGFQFKL